MDEKTFKMIKFRTMTDAKDENGQLLPDEARFTKFGSFLRNYSLDELPELINVIKGDMSLIGPRPLYTYYLPYYTDEEALRHVVRGGITGLAQINGRVESQERHLAIGLKVYDPYIIKDVVKNQYHDLDKFLNDIDFVVIMVKHDEIKGKIEKLKEKVVLDCHNICKLPNVYHI